MGAMTADLVIRGGTVVDGTGAPGYEADLAVTDGMISEIGARLDGTRVLDASGQVVTPGSPDIHSHYDAQAFWDPALTPSSFHGATSVIAGNCGFSIAPCRPEQRELRARTLQHVEDLDLATLEVGIPWDFETFPEHLDSVERHGAIFRPNWKSLDVAESSAHVSQLCDACLPTDLLGNWVREKRVIPLERAVHKLTGEPATVFGLDGPDGGRGVLRVGMAAPEGLAAKPGRVLR